MSRHDGVHGVGTNGARDTHGDLASLNELDVLREVHAQERESRTGATGVLGGGRNTPPAASASTSGATSEEQAGGR